MSRTILLSAIVAGCVASVTSQTALGGAGAQMGEGFECQGGNACKGKGDCGGPGYSCAGNNSCRGKGFVTTKSKQECDELVRKVNAGGKRKSHSAKKHGT